MSGVEGTPLTGARLAGTIVPELAGLDVRIIDRLEPVPRKALRWLAISTAVAALTAGAAAASIGGLALGSRSLAVVLGVATAAFVLNLHRVGTASAGVPLWEDRAGVDGWRPSGAPIVVFMLLGTLLAQVPVAWVVPSRAAVDLARVEVVERYRSSVAVPFDDRMAGIDERLRSGAEEPPGGAEGVDGTPPGGSAIEQGVSSVSASAPPVPSPSTVANGGEAGNRGLSAAERAALVTERAALEAERDRTVETATARYAAQVATLPLTAVRVELAWSRPSASGFVSLLLAVLVAWPALLRTFRPGPLRAYERERHAEEHGLVIATHAATQADAIELLSVWPTFGPRRALALRFVDPVFRRKELLLGVHTGTIYTDSEPLRLTTHIHGLDIDARLASYEGSSDQREPSSAQAKSPGAATDSDSRHSAPEAP
jgi:hypothetical protein